MRITVNGVNVLVRECEVTASINSLCRTFELVSNDPSQIFKMGDMVEIRNQSNDIMIQAEIEFISMSGVEYVYSGRNATKNLVKCYAEETVQFPTGNSVASIIRHFSEPFGIKVVGDSNLPVDCSMVVVSGENLGAAVMRIAGCSDCVIYSNPQGHIIVETKPVTGPLHYEYGLNISSREFVHNISEKVDRYTAISQSSRQQSGNNLSNIVGSIGNGKTYKTFISPYNLDITECEKLAKYQRNKDSRKSFSYTISVDVSQFSDINIAQTVTDSPLNIEGLMVVVGYVMMMGVDSLKLTITLQYV